MATANGHPALPLSKRLKRASRETHNISNALVSARLVALFTDRSLYGKALGCFYHVHAELERCLDAAAAKDPRVRELGPALRPLYRSAAFAEDLQYFLGPGWREEVEPVGPAVAAYLAHLRRVCREHPPAILAHSYTQHLACLLGGSLVGRAARRGMGLPEGRGTASFEYAQPVGALKAAYLDGFDALEQHLSEGEVEEMVAEHLEAFRLNNDILRAFRLGYLAPLRAALKLAPARVVWGAAAAAAALAAVAAWQLGGRGWLLGR